MRSSRAGPTTLEPDRTAPSSKYTRPRTRQQCSTGKPPLFSPQPRSPTQRQNCFLSCAPRPRKKKSSGLSHSGLIFPSMFAATEHDAAPRPNVLGVAENSRPGFKPAETSVFWEPVWANGETVLGIEPPLRRAHSRPRTSGKERDSESGLDDFGARYYSSQYGRFMMPDFLESDDTDPLPYADLKDPQTLNLYAYARNNPLSYVDKNGHHLECTSSTTSDENGIHQTVTCHDVPDTFPQNFFDMYSSGNQRFINTKVLNDLQSGQLKPTYAEIPVDREGIQIAKFVEDILSGAKPLAESPELQKIIDQLWKPTDKIPGGTIGAVREELKTGGTVGGKLHSIKLTERVNQLQNSLTRGVFSAKDSSLAKAIIQVAKDTLAGK